MKGPYERWKYDMRRVWECPVCRHHERRLGQVTSMICKCQMKKKPTERVCMKLIAEGGRRTEVKTE